MPVSLKTPVERTAKTPVTACHARVGGLCGFCSPAERAPIQQQKTRRCADVRERCGNAKRRRRTPPGGFQQREKPQAAKQPAMDLSRGKITFFVYRGVLEKSALNQALAAGHLK